MARFDSRLTIGLAVLAGCCVGAVFLIASPPGRVSPSVSGAAKSPPADASAQSLSLPGDAEVAPIPVEKREQAAVTGLSVEGGILTPRVEMVPADALVIRSPDGGQCCDQVIPAGRYLVEDGILTIFHASGAVEEVGPWDGYRRQGFWESFDRDGNLVLSGEYVDGLAVGVWERRRPNGMVQERATTLNGQFHGPRVVWREDGAIDDAASGMYAKGSKLY